MIFGTSFEFESQLFAWNILAPYNAHHENDYL